MATVLQVRSDGEWQQHLVAYPWKVEAPNYRFWSGTAIKPSKFIAEKLPLKIGCPEAAIRRPAPQS